MRVSVIGAGRVDAGTAAVAEELGRLLGERGHTLVAGAALTAGLSEAAAAASCARPAEAHAGRAPRRWGSSRR